MCECVCVEREREGEGERERERENTYPRTRLFLPLSQDLFVGKVLFVPNKVPLFLSVTPSLFPCFIFSQDLLRGAPFVPNEVSNRHVLLLQADRKIERRTQRGGEREIGTK